MIGERGRWPDPGPGPADDRAPDRAPAEPPTDVLPLPGAGAGRPSTAAALVRGLRAQAPLLVVLAVVVVGFVRIAEQHWREGTVELGLALLVGAVLRAVCPEHRAGLLAVRERRADVVLYAAFGLVVLLVSLTITGGPLARG